MRVLSKRGGIAETHSYLIVDEESKQAVVFDAPDHTIGPLLDEAEKRGWEIAGLWLTHGHFDHVADHAAVTGRFPSAKVLMHDLDEVMLEHPERIPFRLPFAIPPRKADEYVADGDDLRLGPIPVRVLHTPGHSPGHVAYHFPDHDLLVGGDLILMGAIGRTDLPGGDAAVLADSIRRIMALPGHTRLLPGHGEPSTLDHERQTNPYVRSILGL